MFSRLTTIAICALLLGTTASPPASAGMTRIPGIGGAIYVPVVSYRERPFQSVVRQQFDFSCGSAAIATLLSHHYERPTAEVDVFQAMYEGGDQDHIREVGFSLLDMKSFLSTLGYRADGFRLSIEKLAMVGIPAIALIEVDGYRHFVVVKGIRDDAVLVGDPAKGIRSYDRVAFEELRVDDIVFVIRDQTDIAKAGFNTERDWSLQPVTARLGDAIDRRVLADHGALARIPSQFRYPMRVN